MNIMITGGSGFLGSRLALYYGKNHTVWAPAHRELDLTDMDALREALAAHKPAVILHCAAVSDIGETARDPERSYAANVTAPVCLAQAAKEIGAKLVICSSDQVYCTKIKEGQSEEEFLRFRREDEEDLQPVPLYGQQKLEAERRCLQANPDTVALRLTWMYDERTPYEKERNKGTLTAAIRTAVKKAMDEGKPAVLPQSVTDHRGVTDVMAVVKNMEKAWQLPGGAYNFGSPNCRNMAQTLQDGLPEEAAKYICLQETTGDLRNLTMDMEKLNAAGIYFKDTAEALHDWLQSHALTE